MVPIDEALPGGSSAQRKRWRRRRRWEKRWRAEGERGEETGVSEDKGRKAGGGGRGELGSKRRKWT